MTSLCSCTLVSCDACDKRVPKGETAFIPFGPGNSVGDGTFCAECRGADASDVHPTCHVCGQCDDCEHGPGAP